MPILLNAGLLLAIAACVYVAWRMNLFECALLLGQSLFSLLVAVGLSAPVAGFIYKFFKVPLPYAGAVACFLLWIGVFVGIGYTARTMLGDTISAMRFHDNLALPGKVVAGLLAGYFLSSILSLVMVTIPVIEGAYLRNDAQVVGRLHERAAAIYARFAASRKSRKSTEDRILRRTQVRAGVWWAKANVGSEPPSGQLEFVEKVRARYAGLIDARTVEELRGVARDPAAEKAEAARRKAERDRKAREKRTREEAEAARKKAEEDRKAREERIKDMVAEVNALLAAEELEGASAVAEKILASEPESKEAREMIAAVELKRLERKRAEERDATLTREKARSMVKQAETYLGNEQYRLALDELEAAAALDPLCPGLKDIREQVYGKGVQIRITGSAGIVFRGRYGTAEGSKSVSGKVPKVFFVRQKGVLSMIFRKKTAAGTLIVEVVKEGKLLAKQSTEAENGMVSLSQDVGE